MSEVQEIPFFDLTAEAAEVIDLTADELDVTPFQSPARMVPDAPLRPTVHSRKLLLIIFLCYIFVFIVLL